MDPMNNPDAGRREAQARGRSLVVSGVLVYTVANIITKVIGLLFKVPMQSLLGDEGMGYFNAAYTVYVWFYMISTAGLPVAVSTLVAESRARGRFLQVRRIYRITLALFLVIGTVGTAVMLALSRQFASFVDINARYCIIALAPTLFFVCLSSAFRGYFQGFRLLVPTGISQIIESAGKLAVGIIFARYAMAQGKSLPVVAAYAVFGLTVGVLGGMLYLWVTKLCFRPERYDLEYRADFGNGVPECDSGRHILGRLAKIALPITLSSSVMSLASLIDTAVMTTRLEAAGVTHENAVRLYGSYSTQCVSMFNLPPAFIYPVAYAIVPLISECMARRERKRMASVLDSSFRMTAIIALPCALGMAAIPRYILASLFTQSSAELMAPLLSVLAVAVFFIGVLATTNCALQAAGRERLPIISMLAGAGVKLAASWLLIGIPAIGIYGTPISTVLCYAVAASLNLYFVAKRMGFLPSVGRVFLRPLAAALLSSGTALAAGTLAERLAFGGHAAGRAQNVLVLGCAIVPAVLVYIVVLFRIRGVEPDDVLMLPKGKKLLALTRKLRLFPRGV